MTRRPVTPKTPLAAALRHFADASGKSIDQLANEADIKPRRLWSYLRGDREPTFATVRLIAKAMGVTATKVYKMAESRDATPATPGR